MRISDWSSDVCSADLRREGGRRDGQAVAQRGEGARRRRLAGDDREDDAGDQRLGFLVPMRFAGFAGSVIDTRVGPSHADVGEIEAVRVDAVARSERSRGEAGGSANNGEESSWGSRVK